MATSHENPFLIQKYPDLSGSKPVESAVGKAQQEGGKIQGKEDRIQAYLDRLERLVLDPKKEQKAVQMAGQTRPRALSLLRKMVMDKYVRANRQKMAEGAARVEERAAHEMGIEARYGEREIEQRGEIAVADLEKSLDNWISYLSDANEPYPVWFRYYAFRNILDLSDYDKDKGEFSKRSAGTARLFPDIDRGALAYVQDMIEASKDLAKLERLRRAQETAQTPGNLLVTKDKAERFAKLPFAKQYAEGIKQAGEITPELREETRGKWVKYQQGTDPTALWASLQNKGTAWCTKGFATAETQLKGGDFYVYYTLDKQGKPAIPRIAIRMQGDAIGEVRGVADNQQNLEGNMADIADKKICELPGAERFKAASADVKRLNEIYGKSKAGQQLTKEDLIFLYEIDSPIRGFGYGAHPRIKEIRDQRNPKEDAPVILGCRPDQVAWSPDEVKEETKAYVGPFFPNIFQKLAHLEHVYTSFPEGKIVRYEVQIGGKTEQELERELESSGFKIDDYARYMMRLWQFTTEKKREELKLIRLKVGDLSNGKDATTEEIYQKAEEIGLELCPAEVGPHLRLKLKDQLRDEWFTVAMEQFADPEGYPLVFELERGEDGLWLHSCSAEPSEEWNPDSRLVFRSSAKGGRSASDPANG